MICHAVSLKLAAQVEEEIKLCLPWSDLERPQVRLSVLQQPPRSALGEVVVLNSHSTSCPPNDRFVLPVVQGWAIIWAGRPLWEFWGGVAGQVSSIPSPLASAHQNSLIGLHGPGG